MAVLKSNFDSEKRCRADLESKVVQMNQIISTAQEALQQEQKTVELLRQQIPKSDKVGYNRTIHSYIILIRYTIKGAQFSLLLILFNEIIIQSTI